MRSQNPVINHQLLTIIHHSDSSIIIYHQSSIISHHHQSFIIIINNHHQSLTIITSLQDQSLNDQSLTIINHLHQSLIIRHAQKKCTYEGFGATLASCSLHACGEFQMRPKSKRLSKPAQTGESRIRIWQLGIHFIVSSHYPEPPYPSNSSQKKKKRPN